MHSEIKNFKTSRSTFRNEGLVFRQSKLSLYI